MLHSQNVSERIEYQGAEPPRLARQTELVHPSNATIALVFAYWSSWVLLGVGAALQNDALNVFDAWWMVLGLFWVSANAVCPVYLLPNRVRLLGMAIAGLAVGMLIYGSFNWFIRILIGWNLSEARGWLRVAALPLRAVFASMLTAIVLTSQLRRAIGLCGPVPAHRRALYWTDSRELHDLQRRALASALALELHRTV